MPNRTLVIFKPDCVQRRLIGKILDRFESKGLRPIALKLMKVDRSLAEKHYTEHKERPFFGTLLQFITGGPVVVGVFEGPRAIEVVRNLIGPTDGATAPPGTIRGDFALSRQNNLIHASDGPDAARREISLWFQPQELVDYSISGSEWIEGSS